MYTSVREPRTKPPSWAKRMTGRSVAASPVGSYTSISRVWVTPPDVTAEPYTTPDVTVTAGKMGRK